VAGAAAGRPRAAAPPRWRSAPKGDAALTATPAAARVCRLNSLTNLRGPVSVSVSRNITRIRGRHPSRSRQASRAPRPRISSDLRPMLENVNEVRSDRQRLEPLVLMADRRQKSASPS
jgi:hypothetical protein